MKYAITVDGNKIEQIETANVIHHMEAEKVCYEWAKERFISENGVRMVRL